ncbi:hypothetical protein BLIC_b00404 [Bifidobacterium longum subsp. infantis]|uniref:Uncharacterized protein n=1 Tax=Bifidobacterium longum subsp. infantis TaxID=1682 RepID=A0ABP1X377_BIFLI|nr:hypothetical protein BLIC_a00401 [Bifidobacterium longum subsp. infantis]CEE97793.1 hypothetical protein BLIC_b00404 [Bifidobacterium longum subsp. infantis]CEE98628.1 hypothetical protein BLIC_c00409 [Bifidobacterium longum subsp. infantis]CEF01871.1 hypothetical protein BLIC_e00408 [Bifidobacterium longum subsp. infantis]CEF04412.1 hypothetical protein BLIC_g00407 [Bifidobacterium longum subsp. infantis]
MEQPAPIVSIWKHSYSIASSFFSEWKSPQAVWNLPVMPTTGLPRLRTYLITIGKLS